MSSESGLLCERLLNESDMVREKRERRGESDEVTAGSTSPKFRLILLSLSDYKAIPSSLLAIFAGSQIVRKAV